MALSIAGKTAIVTGAGSGINLAFANALLRKRCNVVFADQKLRPEAEELVSNHSRGSKSRAKAVFQHTDVTNWQHLERMFEVASKEFGGADIVCPGAGIFEPPFSNFWYPPNSPPSTDTTSFATLAINLAHPIRTTQLALAHFLSRPGTRSPRSIIHISSIAGQVTPLHSPLYIATKHGISGFVRSLAPLENRVGVRVAAVAPGIIRTPIWSPERARWVTADDIWVEPEEVADVMVALAEGGEMDVVLRKDEGVGTKKVQVEGGLILEVGKAKVRVVEPFMDEGPSGEGHTISGAGAVDDEIIEHMQNGNWGLAQGGGEEK